MTHITTKLHILQLWQCICMECIVYIKGIINIINTFWINESPFTASECNWYSTKVIISINRLIISVVSLWATCKEEQEVCMYLQPTLELELLCRTPMTHHIHDPELLKYTATLFRKMMPRLREIRFSWSCHIFITSSKVCYTVQPLLYHCTADSAV